MNKDITRQYNLPKSLSSRTTIVINQFKVVSSTNSPQGNNDTIPEAHDLLHIKQELEGLLPTTENRIKDLYKSVDFIENSVDICDTESSSVEQEKKDTTTEILQTSLKIPKNDIKRQAAFEQRTNSPNVVYTSESPLHSNKLTKPNELLKTKKAISSKHNVKKKTHKPEQVDFVRVKPKDQIPITTFWSTLDSYFRNLTEEDREFLLQKSDQGKPYLIPPLGQHYLEKWLEEDQDASIETIPNSHHHDPKLRYLAGPQDLTDSQLLQNDIGSGTLTERLISSLVLENILPKEALDITTDDEMYISKTTLKSEPPDEIVGFEERLKRELCYVGLFGDEDIDWNAKEDDEICAELRSLGREFKEQVKVNEAHKKRLLEVVDCQLQFEQYRQVLDTLDSQVEQGYLKRFRPQKSKKRKSTGPKAVLSENTVYAMEKRNTWIHSLGLIFQDKDMVMPETSIYQESTPDYYIE